MWTDDSVVCLFVCLFAATLRYTSERDPLTLPVALIPFERFDSDQRPGGGTDLQLAVEDDVLQEARRLMLGREAHGEVDSRWRRLRHCPVVRSRCGETAGRFWDLHRRLLFHTPGPAAVLLLLWFLLTLPVALAYPPLEATHARVSLWRDESQS